MTLDKREYLTPEQALAMLDVQDGRVHTLVEAHWDRADVEKLIRSGATLEKAGPTARGINHGLVVWQGPNDPVFMATKAEEDGP